MKQTDSTTKELGSKKTDRFNNRGQHAAMWRWGCFTGGRRKSRVLRRAHLIGSDQDLTERKKKTEQVPPWYMTEAPHSLMGEVVLGALVWYLISSAWSQVDHLSRSPKKEIHRPGWINSREKSQSCILF